MAAHKLTKKELKKDSFITTMLQAFEFSKTHQNMLFVGLLIVIVIIAGSIWFTNARRQTREEASSQFSEGLAMFRAGDLKTSEELFKMVSERHANIQEGTYSFFFAGKCALLGGRNTDAIEWFDEYLERSGKFPFFKDAAMDGKAVALENERRYGEAAVVYFELAQHIETNRFMENVYLRRAAENFELGGQHDRAIEIMEELVEKTTGIEKLELEIELKVLKS